MNAACLPGPGKSRLRVGVAVVESPHGFLVGRRMAGQALEGLAEFPGGKCRAGESARDCAVRECLEESGVETRPVALLMQVNHTYSHAAVDLEFWMCRPVGEMSEPREPFEWVPATRLSSLEFPAANARLLDLLHQRLRDEASCDDSSGVSG